jgi:hypothetical protein
MATITANAVTGDWNVGSSWVGGVVPTSADDVILPSGSIITANVDITVLSLFADRGILSVTASRQIVMTGAGLTINDTAVSSGVGGIDITGSGISVWIVGAVATGTIRAAVRIAGANVTLDFIGSGNLRGTTHSSNAISPALVNVIGANCVVNYTGSMVNASATVSALIGGIRVSAAGCTVNYLGTITNGTYSSIVTVSDTIVNFNGSLVGSNYAAISCTLDTGQLNVQGTVTQSGDINPFYSRVFNINGPLQWNMSGGNLYTADQLTGYPPQADVRSGEVFGPVGEFTGTLSPVNVNVQQLASDLLTEISSSPDPLAERLRNVSTIQSTGAQLQALTIAP